MFDDDYPNNFNYNEHFLSDNLDDNNNIEENKEELEFDEQNYNANNVINNMKKIMDNF